MTEWRTLAEHRHAVSAERFDPDNRNYFVTRCGQRIWPSWCDRRIPDPLVCLSCCAVLGLDVEQGARVRLDTVDH